MKVRSAVYFLILYSIAIISIEFSMGAQEVRYYLTDIEGPVLFYAINTSLTTIFLALIIYNFILCLRRNDIARRIYQPGNLFLYSQILVFGFLLLDERFMIHERLGRTFDFEDALLLLLLGLIELLLLYRFGELTFKKTPKFSALCAASIAFALMIFIDAFLPSDLFLRLSLEDLSKAWGCFFLFLYSLRYYEELELKNI